MLMRVGWGEKPDAGFTSTSEETLEGSLRGGPTGRDGVILDGSFM
jgi:hypothetical protein